MTRPARTSLALVAALTLALAACAGHADRTRDIRSALDAGNAAGALVLVNEELGVGDSSDLPDEAGGDNALLLLDRAMILQQLDRYELASRDLRVADKQVEVLDFSVGAMDDVGRYMFSDDTGPYRAPAYEKLLVNTFGMVTHLARGDLPGARVEARRFSIIREFVADHDDASGPMDAPGCYLAGFTFERSGSADEALRYYDEALVRGSFPSLDGPITRLAAKSAYRSPRIDAVLARTRAPAPRAPQPGGEADGAAPELVEVVEAEGEADVQRPDGDAGEDAQAAPAASKDAALVVADARPGEILVVVGFGRVPAKKAKRVPIGLALTWAAGGISPHHHRQANEIAAQGLVSWVNYPELGQPRGEWGIPGFALNGRWQPIEGALAVDLAARRAWDEAKGTVLGAAIVRMISRFAAGQVARHASGDSAIGLLLSLGTQAALTAADTPDTRSWATLPARIAIGRAVVAPGVHYVDLVVNGVAKRQRVSVRSGGYAVVNLTHLA